jgi:tRNA (pseudouridine54-N1)-methyltransferase
MRRFVVIGQKATASPDFSLSDLPGTSGRLDVLVRCLRAALLVSHGLRRDTIVYLVLLGGPTAPRAVRISGGSARFIRPDERSLATLLMKVLSAADAADAADLHHAAARGFVDMKVGVAVARGGVGAVLADLGPMTRYVLDERGTDIRRFPGELGDAAFFLGDHLGFDAPTRAAIEGEGTVTLSLGPVAVHAEDAITILCNELDRRGAEAAAEG